MCTIMSIDRSTFDDNKEEIIRHIRKDAVSNPDGFSLVTSGSYDYHATVVRSMSLEPVLATLLNDPLWSRMWLHCRYATTTKINLQTTHGFEAGTNYIMHNGVLTTGQARKLDVDSRMLANIVAAASPQAAIDYILLNETYANVFIIDPEKGEWSVTRVKGGSLYTDNYGNYSTNPFLNVNILVTPEYTQTYDEEVKTSVPSYYTYGRYNSSYKSYAGAPVKSVGVSESAVNLSGWDNFIIDEDD